MPKMFFRLCLSFRLLMGVVFWCAAGVALGAPQCASYQDGEENATLSIVSPTRLEVRPRNQPPRFYRYHQDGDRLEAVNLSDLYDTQTLTRPANGKTLTGLYGDDSQQFLRVASFACQTDAAPSSDSDARACLEDLTACQDTLRKKTDAQIEALCAARLPFACLDLLERAQKSSRKSGVSEEPPPVCREGEASFDADACGEIIGQAIAKEMAAVFQSLYADPVILPAALLERLPDLCQANVSAELCAKAAEHLWDAGQFLRTREVFIHACQAPIEDPVACQRAEALEILSGANSTPLVLEALPCGHYVASGKGGLMSEFDFGDRGKTRRGELFSARARLEDGRVRIRHDKGGDFVLRALADGTLVGQDEWNRYAIYRRDGGQTQCADPVIYHETELKMDCRAGEDMESCCARGGTQGCNGMGHAAALRGDWQTALTSYARLCRMGVRSGCENVVTVFTSGGVGKARETLEAICAEDARHVACDVMEMIDWDALDALRAFSEAMNEALKEALKDSEEDAETDTPDEAD
ncbi:MAG: hypothetical protein LBF51_09075 [Zoogloeaceae bacterium]|nr:hypothetical protein [Zoogloeaceae bacterium]